MANTRASLVPTAPENGSANLDCGAQHRSGYLKQTAEQSPPLTFTFSKTAYYRYRKCWRGDMLLRRDVWVCISFQCKSELGDDSVPWNWLQC